MKSAPLLASASLALRRACLGLAVGLGGMGAAGAQTTGRLVGLYHFTGGADGSAPFGGVTPDRTGTILYGETSAGGNTACVAKVGDPKEGCGTVYSFSEASGLKVLATFDGLNGAYGKSTLTLVGSTLYGTTNNGGSSDAGVVFSVNTDGSNFTLLHQFDGSDGINPGNLRLGKGNILYGVALLGGAHGDGVLFSITPSGTYTDLHDFAGGTDGNQPFTLLIASNGTVVGSTFLGSGNTKFCMGGCGTLFEYVPATGSYSVPYSYTTGGGSGGTIGSIGAGPTVYGATEYSVYGINATSGYTDLADFNQLELGAVASGPLLAPDGALIGVNGASSNQNVGSIYSVSNHVLTILTLFGGSFGGVPYSQPILLPGNKLIGTATMYGLCEDCGTIWEYLP